MSLKSRILEILSRKMEMRGVDIRQELQTAGLPYGTERFYAAMGNLELLGLVNGRHIELGDITRNLMVGNKIYSITPDGRDELKRESWSNLE